MEENDPLPKSGQITLVAGQTLHSGSEDALVFTLWEGGIKDPIEDNRYIGTYRVTGKSLPEGTVFAGAEIICDYEMSDSGALRLGVSIPSIGANLQQANFYSRQEGQTALDDQPHLLAEACRNAQVLVHEATYTQAAAGGVNQLHGHSTAAAVAQFAQAAGLPHLVLTHFSARYQADPRRSPSILDVQTEAARHYQGALFLAEDFMRLRLGRDGVLTQI